MVKRACFERSVRTSHCKKEDSTTLAEYTYDPLNRITRRDIGGIVRSDSVYDIANQLTTLTHTKIGGPQIGQFGYAHDNVGNRLSMAASEGTHTYDYNNIYELESVSGASTHNYDYDNVGNRVTADGDGYSANALNQYTQVNSQTLTYDTNGNLTDDGERTLTYDPADRLATASYAGANSSYQFDAFNRRIAKTVDGQKTWYIHDGDEVIAEYSNTGSLQAEYIAGVGLDEWLVIDNGSGRHYYAQDGLGSTRYLTDTAGNIAEQYQYDPYGNVSILDPSGTQRLSSDANNPYLFTGRRLDQKTGLYHYRNRGYHPELGRFLQRDPLGYIDSFNLYSYVVNNPVNWVDPFGLRGTSLQPARRGPNAPWLRSRRNPNNRNNRGNRNSSPGRSYEHPSTFTRRVFDESYDDFMGRVKGTFGDVISDVLNAYLEDLKNRRPEPKPPDNTKDERSEDFDFAPWELMCTEDDACTEEEPDPSMCKETE